MEPFYAYMAQHPVCGDLAKTRKQLRKVSKLILKGFRP
jgi:hypothetical protein